MLIESDERQVSGAPVKKPAPVNTRSGGAVAAEATYGVLATPRHAPRRYSNMTWGDCLLQIVGVTAGFSSFWAGWTVLHTLHWFGG